MKNALFTMIIFFWEWEFCQSCVVPVVLDMQQSNILSYADYG